MRYAAAARCPSWAAAQRCSPAGALLQILDTTTLASALVAFALAFVTYILVVLFQAKLSAA